MTNPFCAKTDRHRHRMKVPLLDVNAQNLALGARFVEKFNEVLSSGNFVLGAEVEAFEDEIAALCGTRHAVGLSSGSDALLVALMAAGISPGDEVICPAFTFFATAGSVERLGAVPVFADVSPDSFKASAFVAESTRIFGSPTVKWIESPIVHSRGHFLRSANVDVNTSCPSAENANSRNLSTGNRRISRRSRVSQNSMPLVVERATMRRWIG